MRDIPGYPGYKITKDGTVYSKRFKNRPMKPSPSSDGYLGINLRKQGKYFRHLVHRLVLTVFTGPCPEGMECRHLNGNNNDNRLSNLKWGTKAENTLDGARHGSFKLTKANVEYIRILYRRGHTQQQLAEKYNVTPSNISRIVNNKQCNYG